MLSSVMIERDQATFLFYFQSLSYFEFLGGRTGDHLCVGAILFPADLWKRMGWWDRKLTAIWLWLQLSVNWV